jgi:hypothetical protein
VVGLLHSSPWNFLQHWCNSHTTVTWASEVLQWEGYVREKRGLWLGRRGCIYIALLFIISSSPKETLALIMVVHTFPRV